MKGVSQFVRPAWIFAAHLLLFSLARVVLYLCWRADFAELSAAGLLRAFGLGLAFDASVITLGLSLVILALCLPFRFALDRRWRATWSWIAFAHLCVVALVLAADVAYFGIVRRHAGPEAFALLDDPRLIVAMIWDGYRAELAGIIVLLVSLALAWRQSMRWDERRPVARAPAWSLLVLAPVALVVVRGNASGKPMGIADAFESGSVATGYLALSGPYSLVHTAFGSRSVPSAFMPWDEAVENVRGQVFSSAERVLDPAFPLLRARSVKGERQPNVVVLLLESWDAEIVDALRADNGQPALGMTPNFDALARQGVLFTNFYAAGQRSTHGLLAVLAGLPSLPGMPYLGRGIEQSRLCYLGQMALAEGYRTYFLQGSNEGSFRVDSIAALAGFESYMGKEGIVALRGNPPMANWGVWDHDLLQAAHQEFAGSARPFLGVAFTTSTHLPYQVPEGHPLKYPADTDEHCYWNSVHYADWALGQFFASARQAGYFDDTIFVLVADHRSGIDATGRTAPELHHIPCLIVAPGLKPRIERGIASQLDVLPSIVDLADWCAPEATLGRSLFDDSKAADRGALCMRNEIVVRIEDQGWVSHDLSRRLDAHANSAGSDLHAIERRLLAAVQVVATALRTNRVMPPTAMPRPLEVDSH